MINNILAASRIPYILQQKGIEVEDNLLHVEINHTRGVYVQLYKSQDILKFDGWKFVAFDAPKNELVGRIHVEFEGIEFLSCVREGELSLLES